MLQSKVKSGDRQVKSLDPEKMALRQFCNLMLDTDDDDLDDVADYLGDFCSLIMKKAKSIYQISTVLNASGENLLHIVAKRPKLKSLLTLKEFEKREFCFAEMLQQKNKRDETPLHYACNFKNLEMLEYIKGVFGFSKKELYALGMIKNIDGQNALQLLLMAGLSSEVIKQKSQLDQNKELVFKDIKRDFFSNHPFDEQAYMMLEIFCTILYASGERDGIAEPNPEMAIDIDRYGNNALMLALYACDDKVLAKIINALPPGEPIEKVISQSLINNPITPLQFVSAFGSAKSMSLLCSMLGMRAPQIMIEQNTLEWCFKTRAVDEKQFCDVVRVVAGFYGDEFKEKILIDNGRGSLFSQSLRRDNAIAEVLLERSVSHELEVLPKYLRVGGECKLLTWVFF